MPDEIEDDLVLGGDQPTGEEAEYYEEPIDLHREVDSAYSALAAISEIDEAMLPANRKRMIRTIRRKALEILYQNIIDIHSEVFGRKEDDDENEEDE